MISLMSKVIKKYNWKDDSIKLSLEILRIQEINGMLPPIEPGRTVYDLDLGVPEWEDEDET